MLFCRQISRYLKTQNAELVDDGFGFGLKLLAFFIESHMIMLKMYYICFRYVISVWVVVLKVAESSVV